MTDFASIAVKLAAQGLPAIAAALGGPAAGAVVARVAQRLGTPPEVVKETPEVIVQAIAADPEAKAALTELDLELERERRATWESAVAADERQQAFQEENIREARATSPNLDPSRVKMLYTYLAVVFLSCLALGGAAIIFGADTMGDMILGLFIAIIGGWAADLRTILSYFTGTSSGSSAKERAAAAERIMDKSSR